MKYLLAYLLIVLGLGLVTNVKADDIRDFQIEGISIGDSLLDHFSEKEINSMLKTEYPKSDKYIMLGYNSITKFNSYDGMSFHLKRNDDKFIIHSLKAGIYYRKNFNKCMVKKKSVVSDLKSIFKNIDTKEYEFKYKIDDGKSIAFINDFALDNNDKIRVWCVDWSKTTKKKRNFVDNLAVSISPRYFLNWLNNEAGHGQ